MALGAYPPFPSGCGSPAHRGHIPVLASPRPPDKFFTVNCLLFGAIQCFCLWKDPPGVGVFFLHSSLFKRDPGWYQLRVLCAATWCLMLSLHCCHGGGTGWQLSGPGERKRDHRAPGYDGRTFEGEAEAYLESGWRPGWGQERRRVETVVARQADARVSKGRDILGEVLPRDLQGLQSLHQLPVPGKHPRLKVAPTIPMAGIMLEASISPGGRLWSL